MYDVRYPVEREKKKIKWNKYIAYSAAALIAKQTLIRLNFVNYFFCMDKSAVSRCQTN